MTYCQQGPPGSQDDTVRTLNCLAERGYKVSPSKAQISKSRFSTSGPSLYPGPNAGSSQETGHLVTMGSKQWEGAEGLSRNGIFSHLWDPISNFGITAKPLYETM